MAMCDARNLARTSFDLTQPLSADDHTLLLDQFEDDFKPDGEKPTAPVQGVPGRPSAGSGFVPGRFGQALALYQPGPPKSMLDRLAELGVRTICFHEHWTDIQNYTSTTHDEPLRSLVKAETVWSFLGTTRPLDQPETLARRVERGNRGRRRTR